MSKINDYIWSVSNHLVKNHHFSLINKRVTTNAEVGVNLFKNTGNKIISIRMIPITNYIWPNHLLNDIENIKNNALKAGNEANFFSPKLISLNLYVFATDPTEEIEKLVNKHSSSIEKYYELYFGIVDLTRNKIGLPDGSYERLFLEKEVFTRYFSGNVLNEPVELVEEIKEIEQQRMNELKGLFHYGKPYLTYLLIFINSIVFLLMSFYGGSTSTNVLINFGAIEPYLIAHGEYWRLVAPIFLHIGFLHFLLNNMAIYFIGRLTEKIYGTLRFFAIYFIAGIIGNISSFLFLPDTIGAGASGSIWGLFGALLYFGYVYPNLFFRTMGRDIITIIVINILFSLSVSNINNFAHFGGLLGGFIATAIIYLPNQKKKKILMQAISIFLILLIGVATYWGVTERDVKGSPSVYIKGLEAIDNNNIDEAYEIFSHLVQAYPEIPDFHFYYANLLLQKGNLPKAEEHYKIAIDLDLRIPEVHYALGFLYYMEEELDNAILHLEMALRLAPDYQKAQFLLNEIMSGNSTH